jgi:hypothetical protein
MIKERKLLTAYFVGKFCIAVGVVFIKFDTITALKATLKSIQVKSVTSSICSEKMKPQQKEFI